MTDSNSPELVDAEDDYIDSLIQRISGSEFDRLISEVRVMREHFQRRAAALAVGRVNMRS